MNRARRHAAKEAKRGKSAIGRNNEQIGSSLAEKVQSAIVVKRICIWNPEKFKKITCTEQRRNKVCQRDDECWFAHSKEELRQKDQALEIFLVDHR